MSHAKDVGDKFERETVRDLINQMGSPKGIFAKRIWYSGAGLQKPYDVEVRRGEPEDSPVVLEVEAKRRIRGKALALGPKELDLVGPKHIIVFAVGNFSGRTVPVYVLHSDVQPKGDGELNLSQALRAKPGKKTVSIGHRWVDVPGKTFVLEGWGKMFIVEDFERYFERWLRRST